MFPAADIGKRSNGTPGESVVIFRESVVNPPACRDVFAGTGKDTQERILLLLGREEGMETAVSFNGLFLRFFQAAGTDIPCPGNLFLTAGKSGKRELFFKCFDFPDGHAFFFSLHICSLREIMA